jgi:hypothetical protein
MTRSTRRVDPYKFYSSNSNRFSYSIDSGARAIPLRTGDSDDISFVEDRERLKDTKNAKEKLQDLALQMGSYCLTIDLSCMLKQKRQ